MIGPSDCVWDSVSVINYFEDCLVLTADLLSFSRAAATDT